MVRRCIICGRASNTHRDISFHQFPKNRIIRYIWIDSIGMNEDVKDWHRICSSHFSADDFTFKNKRKILRQGAIPKVKEVKDKVGSCETSLEHDDVNLMSNSLIEVNCCPDIDISNESAPGTSKSLIDVDCCPDIDVSNESPPSTSERLKSPSKNSKKKKKKSKVVNSKEEVSLKKSNECKRLTSDKEYSKNDTPQSVDSVVETSISNNYIDEDGGKKLEFFDSLDDHTSKYRTMTDISMDFGQYSNQMSNNTYGDKNVLSGNTPLHCDLCFKTFDYRSNLLVHRRTHTGEKPYGCDVCGLAFMMKSHLVRHQRTHSGEKPYDCDVCGQSFSERGYLVRHKRRTHPTSNNAYGDKNVLTGNTPLQCNLTITGEKKYECDVCGLAFHILSKLVIHLRKHTGEKPYACDVCGKSFSQQNHLVAHHRTHTGEKPYVCDICSHSFSEKKHLVTHFRTHTGEKPYACELCGKSFSHRHNLVTHNRTHTGEKPYACNVCGRSFSEKGSLVKHNRTHTGERPYECGHCGKMFSTSRDCKRHTLNVHSEKKKFDIIIVV